MGIIETLPAKKDHVNNDVLLLFASRRALPGVPPGALAEGLISLRHHGITTWAWTPIIYSLATKITVK